MVTFNSSYHCTNIQTNSTFSGRKFDAKRLALTMRQEQLENGAQYFSKQEYLTAQQIISFWSRHAANVRAAAATGMLLHTILDCD